LSRSSRRLVLAVALVAGLGAAYYLSHRPSATAPNDVVSPVASRLGPQDIYPDAAITPGATNPDITQANIGETICNPHWSTKRVRPPQEYTSQLKREQLGGRDRADTDPRDYEEDHLIPLELGGNPRDPKNLWPEPYAASVADGGARYKDRVENYLHDQVCAGNISLAAAQQRIANDWYRVYVTSIR